MDKFWLGNPMLGGALKKYLGQTIGVGGRQSQSVPKGTSLPWACTKLAHKALR